jgi:dihydroorotase
MGLPGIPHAAETAIVARDLTLIEATGINAHFCRLSSARSVEMIAHAQQRGLPVTADVAAHQLFLTEDRDALMQGLADGVISAISSDHQPHEADAKLAPFAETEPGISALETLLPLCMKLTQEHGMELATVLRAITSNPADILGVPGGTLESGRVADITIIDPQQEWTLDREKMLSQGKNTPFNGWPFKGMVRYVLLKGQPLYSCH